MSKNAKGEYLLTIKERYIKSTKDQKNSILNEFCNVCDYNRKYAIRLLNKSFPKENNKQRCGSRSVYNSPEIFRISKNNTDSNKSNMIEEVESGNCSLAALVLLMKVKN